MLKKIVSFVKKVGDIVWKVWIIHQRLKFIAWVIFKLPEWWDWILLAISNLS